MRTLLNTLTAAAALALIAGTAHAQSPDVVQSTRYGNEYGTSAIGEKFALTDEQRVVLRRYVRPRAPYGVTTGSDAGVLSAGDRIPDGVMLHPFPVAVYHEAPGLRPYRMMRVGRRAYAVDPRDRTIIEEID